MSDAPVPPREESATEANAMVSTSVAMGLENNAGVWIEDQCRALGVSVSSVARAARIDRSTIFRWKRGEVEPYWGTFKRVKLVIDGFWSDRKDKIG